MTTLAHFSFLLSNSWQTSAAMELLEYFLLSTWQLTSRSSSSRNEDHLRIVSGTCFPDTDTETSASLLFAFLCLDSVLIEEIDDALDNLFLVGEGAFDDAFDVTFDVDFDFDLEEFLIVALVEFLEAVLENVFEDIFPDIMKNDIMEVLLM